MTKWLSVYLYQSRNVTKYFYFVTLLFLSNEVKNFGSTFTCNEVQICVLFLNVVKYS